MKPLTVVVILILVAVGIWNVRRAVPIDNEAIATAQARLDSVPLNFGPWRGREREVDPRVLRAAEALAHSNREYVHERTGKSWNVLLLFGNTGAQGAHDPEVCYRGSGFRRFDTPTHYRLTPEQTGGPVDLWSARFERPEPAPATMLHVYWGWGHEGGWEAPDNPRFELVGRKMVYKIYAQAPTTGPSDTEPANLPDAFLIPFYREVNKALSNPAVQNEPASAAQ